MAAFRNILVHRYNKIEDEVVFGIFRNRLGDFRLFADILREWRKGQEGLPDTCPLVPLTGLLNISVC